MVKPRVLRQPFPLRIKCVWQRPLNSHRGYLKGRAGSGRQRATSNPTCSARCGVGFLHVWREVYERRENSTAGTWERSFTNLSKVAMQYSWEAFVGRVGLRCGDT